MIAFWKDGWAKMLHGTIAGKRGNPRRAARQGHRLYALTNWSAETFPLARQRFEFLKWFEDIVVSGEVKLAKPDPRIFALAIERCRLEPARTVFIDDSLRNVEAGRNAGLHALHFLSPDGLRTDLTELGVL